jgi:hypothetical protein
MIELLGEVVAGIGRDAMAEVNAVRRSLEDQVRTLEVTVPGRRDCALARRTCPDCVRQSNRFAAVAPKRELKAVN